MKTLPPDCKRCGKRLYRDRDRARAAIKAHHPGQNMRAYPCQYLDGWHIGHNPPAVIHGDKAANDLYNRPRLEHAMTDETRTALEHIAKGWPLADVCAVSDLPEQQVRTIAAANGYALDAASKRFRKAPVAKPKPQGIVRRTEITGAGQAPVAADETAGDATPSRGAAAPVLDLIAEGKAHSSARIQRAAVKAQVALEQLLNLLEANRAQEKAMRAAEAEKAKRLERIAELEQMLAAEKAALREKHAAAATVARGDATGPSAKTVRAWAAEHGVDCPPSGRVPARVVDAYLAATEAGAA